MIALPILIAGLLLPGITGYSIVRLLEGRTPVLTQGERLAFGLLTGITVSMFAVWLLHVTAGVPFTSIGIAIPLVVLAAVTGGLSYRLPPTTDVSLAAPGAWKPWEKAAAFLLGLWLMVKLVAGGVWLVSSPPYLDDTVNNWNMRGKMYFVDESFTLTYANEAVSVGSYPPAVPLFKTWLATIYGEWSEPVINTPHMVWFFITLALLYFALRRITDRRWSLLGVYLLASTPLFVVHGFVPYGDGFLACHIFAAVLCLFQAVRVAGAAQLSWYRLGALCTTLLVFTKNEALLLHLPPILLIFGISLMLKYGDRQLEQRDLIKIISWYAGLLVLIGGPWIGYKLMNNLNFGNAKSLSGLGFKWHEGVLEAIWANTLFEGNWAIAPVVMLVLVALFWKRAFGTSLLVLSSFFFIVYLGQFPIYLFTGLATEALMQTGYARGIIHLVPVAALLVTLLLERATKKAVSQ